MTTNTQPLLAHLPASPQTTTPEAIRLLSVWVDLATRAAAACAHGTEDEDSLRDLQVQVEDALIARKHINSEQLIAMTWWESSLTHDAHGVPFANCTVCRRAQLGLPANLPLPRLAGGRR